MQNFCEMCSSRCPIKDKVINVKNVFIQGNHYKTNGMSVCARGASGYSYLYDNERLVKPLIRIRKREENKLKETS